MRIDWFVARRIVALTGVGLRRASRRVVVCEVTRVLGFLESFWSHGGYRAPARIHGGLGARDAVESGGATAWDWIEKRPQRSQYMWA